MDVGVWLRGYAQFSGREAERDKTIDVAKLVSRKAERDHFKQQLAELNRMPREALRRQAAEQRQAMLMAHRSPKELAVLVAINRHRWDELLRRDHHHHQRRRLTLTCTCRSDDCSPEMSLP
jgi:hypothetical protein